RSSSGSAGGFFLLSLSEPQPANSAAVSSRVALAVKNRLLLTSIVRGSPPDLLLPPYCFCAASEVLSDLRASHYQAPAGLLCQCRLLLCLNGRTLFKFVSNSLQIQGR